MARDKKDMIEPIELRIGNWILQEGKKTQVYYVEEDSINGLIPQCFEPLKLTEEWLLKFGFKKYMWNHVNSFGQKKEISGFCKDICFCFISLECKGHTHSFFGRRTFLGNDNKWSFSSYKNVAFNGVVHYSVHQLQNLYFTLTGKELQYNEEIN